jgi:HPt (histidine-containing phosphotransfer) domain-containing protein
MLKKVKLLNKFFKDEDCSVIRKKAAQLYKSIMQEELAHLHLEDYTYDISKAVDELGLDEDLINELVEDYVAQMIKSLVQFETYLDELNESQNSSMKLDYQLFRELAHKNLGVARNLRIKDSEVLLYELMTQDDLQYLMVCIEALKVSIIKLNPKCAYSTLRLIKIKESL